MSKLDENVVHRRYVSLHGDIDYVKSEKIVSALLKLESEDPQKDIVLLIHSDGGKLDSMFSIIDVMNLVRCDVNTVSIGSCYSAAAIILMCGANGKRFSTPNSRMMLHDVSAGAYGKMVEIENNVQEFKKRQKAMKDIILKRTKIKAKEINDILHTDFYMSPKKALELGVIDKRIDSFSQMKLKNW